ncbi:MAG TPA: hypothetical protein VEZ47_04600, partial [Gemmatirosa sp.]|nr:hypothetical protein [Gemmatirosa sp.]
RRRPSAGRWGLLTVALALLAIAPATPAGAQKRPRVPEPSVIRGLDRPSKGGERTGGARDTDVPASHRPPPGMCRIWLEGVPAGQQPAPTDCATAVRSRPANGRVLFGDDYAASDDGPAPAPVPGLGPGTTGVSGPPPAPRERRPPSSDQRAAPGVVAAPTIGGSRLTTPRLHGPAGDDWAPVPDAALRLAVTVLADEAPPAADTTARPLPPRDARPAPAPIPRPARPRVDRRVPADDDGPADDWEDGYAAGYEDALRGRTPRVAGVRAGRGVVGAAPGGAVSGAGSVAASPDGDALVVVPQGGDPRYFNNGRFPPPGRANGVCLDRDQDGWCDDPRFGAPVCRDVDGDGRCDDLPEYAAAAYPSTLPAMRSALDYQQGRGSQAALRWLGTPEVVVRLGDTRRAGLPTRALWFDANSNALLQVWTDRDGDGVADRVEVFRDGRRVKLIGR